MQKRSQGPQFGEKQLVEDLWTRLAAAGLVASETERAWAVEFGAWDGSLFSNTRFLADRGWNCIWIEPNARRFKALEENALTIEAKTKSTISTYQGRVRNSAGERLSDYLSQTAIPERFDLLSIDIDGDDLAAWCTIGSYRASIVIIEYNCSMPVDFVWTNWPGTSKGNSIAAILTVAQWEDYVLVAQTQGNLIFLDKEAATCAEIEPVRPLTFAACWVAFDGTLTVSYAEKTRSAEVSMMAPAGMLHWPWTKSLVLQPVPRLFRRWPRRDWALTIWNVVRALLIHPTIIRTYVKAHRLESSSDAAG